MALPAFAQEAAAPETDSRSAVEEIQITARKVSENLQDSPIAVSAFGAKSIESLGIGDTQDISSMAPNVYLTQTPGSVANLALSIRGVAGAEPLLTREQGVSIYMDDVYIARVTGAIMDLVDVERVEVLRGPQGTLYGRNSTGGAVRFISRKPTEELSFSQRLGTGSWGRLESRSVLNTGELFDGFAASLAYFHLHKDGYRNNTLADDNSDYGAKNNDAIRVALGWDVTETLRLDYAYDYSNLQGHGPGFQLEAITPTLAGALTVGGVNVANLKIARGVATLPPFAPRQTFENLAGNFDGESEHTIRGHNLTAGWDLGFTNFTGIVSYREWENSEAGTELDGNDLGSLTAITNLALLAPVPVPAPYFGAFCPGGVFTGCLTTFTDADLFHATNERHQDQWSVETRFDGDLFTESLKYVAGFYYFNEDFTENNPQELFVPLAPTLWPLYVSNNFVYEGDSRSWALFGNLTYTLPIFDDKLSVSGGIRYSRDDKSFRRFSPIPSTGKNDWDSIDWETTINFAATEDITVYLRGASAYKAGGYNLRTNQLVIAPFDEERVKSVEVGLKSNWFDRRAVLNLTGFWSISTDRQTDVFAAGLGGATSITVNAGETEIPGVEAEFQVIPIDGLTFSGNVGWISPRYNSYPIVDPTPSPDPIVDLKDEAKFGYQPEITTSLGVEYETEPLGADGIVLAARIDGHYTSSRLWSSLDDERGTNNPLTSAYRDLLADPGYWLLDLRFTLSELPMTERTKIRAAVFGKNILDEDYKLSGIDFGSLGFAGAAYGEGATWGVDVTLDF